MLKLLVSEKEVFSNFIEEFIKVPETTLRLQHSLVSISRWESTYKKPFLMTKDLQGPEFLAYVQAMTIDQNVDLNVYTSLSESEQAKIIEYIQDPYSATSFRDKSNKPSREIITSELIYYWMINFGIPIEAQKWHLNRLLALIKICVMKSAKGSKKPASEIAKRNRAINSARKQRYNNPG